jgi:uncharacterized protein YjiS (DUF1127 family)
MTALNKDHSFCVDQSIQPDKSIFSIWLNGAISTLTNLVKSTKNRHAAKQLLSVSDYQLKDMGLTREDLRFIRSAGLFIDPTTELARRSHYRNRQMKT